MTTSDTRPGRTRLEAPLLVLLADTFTMAVGFYMLVPLLAYHLLNNLALTVGVVGVLAAIRGASQQGLMPWSGLLADRLGHRRAIATGVLLRATGFGLFAVVTTVPGLVVASVLAGLGGSLFHPASYAAYTLLSGERNRVQVYSLREILSNLGFVCGPLLGGLLAGFDFQWVAAASAGLFLVAFVITLVGLPRDMHAEGTAPDPAGLLPVLRDRPFLGFCALVAGTWVLVSQLYLAVPVLARDVLPSSVGLGAVYSLAAVVMVVVMLPMTRAADRWLAPRQSLALATLGLAAGLVVMGLWQSAVGLSVGVVVFTLGQVLFSPIMNSEVSRYADPSSVASYFGVHGLALAIGGVVGNLGGGFMYGRLGGTDAAAVPWLVLGGWGLVVCALFLRRSRPVPA
ncbi:MFS transporter [Nocardioides sp. OK12]|uniref:MFS transporter n=1 Tax=Nocardioides sp. OK12 TaxID=2758661 RepID=UPI0021C42A80|nr:MFS transporter [Nocardioides sp. OK12]GHJ57595.1 MFS transporter [Nocardioides sp. OK12]